MELPEKFKEVSATRQTEKSKRQKNFQEVMKQKEEEARQGLTRKSKYLGKLCEIFIEIYDEGHENIIEIVEKEKIKNKLIKGNISIRFSSPELFFFSTFKIFFL